MVKPLKILLAEHDKDIASITKNYLVAHGYYTVMCFDGEETLQVFHSEQMDFVLIDVNLPVVNGFDVVKSIRHSNSEIPVIFFGYNIHHSDIIRGFKIGGDDFMALPLSMEELNLRIEAINKRAKTTEKTQQIFHVGRYTLDTLHHVLIYNGKEKRLTTKELDLLYLFCEYKNRVVERPLALRRVWNSSNYFSARNMDVYIKRLRKMLCEDPDVQLENVHGIGYKLVVNTAT